MTETLDNVMRRVLNDPDIFNSPYDQRMIPLLFQKENWKQLKNAFEKEDKSFFDSQVDNRLKNLRQEAQNSQDWRKSQIEKLISLGESLRKAYETRPNLLRQLFDMFDSIGLVVCNLPDMEDYGKVIENHTLPIVEQFFLYKIDKAPWKEKKALKKTLEYVKELYSMNLNLLEIAFFVRKLNSLMVFMEVIKE